MSFLQDPVWLARLEELRDYFARLRFSEPYISQTQVDTLTAARDFKNNEVKAAHSVVRKADKIIKEIEDDMLSDLGKGVAPDVRPTPCARAKDKPINWSEKAVMEAVAFVVRTNNGDPDTMFRLAKQHCIDKTILGGTKHTLLLIEDDA